MNFRVLAQSLLLGAALALAGCLPDTVNPVGDPAKVAPDARLVGNWAGDMNGEKATVAVIAGEGAMLRIRAVTTDPDGKSEWVVLEGFPAPVKNRSYLNVKFKEEENKTYDPDEPYYVLRYEIADDGTLTLWTMSEQPVVDAIANGFVNGSVDPGTGDRTIHITDSSVVLQNFIEETDPATVFAEKYATFKRATN